MANIEGLNPEFRSRLNNMVAASGGRLTIESAYRSVEEQQALWDASDKSGVWVAPPGQSYHNHGLAADLGGDLDWAHAHAAEFGLWFPMDYEPWHIEVVGSRDGTFDPNVPSNYPAGPENPQEVYKPDFSAVPQAETDPLNLLLGMLGVGNTKLMSSPALPGQQAQPFKPQQEQVPQVEMPQLLRSNLPPEMTGSELERFMALIREHESGGDYRAVGSWTPWGTAKGAYQFLDSTWNYYGGYATAADAPPEIQDARARELMQEYYNQFGNWGDVARSWYAGPSGNNWDLPDVVEYAEWIQARM